MFVLDVPAWRWALLVLTVALGACSNGSQPVDPKITAAAPTVSPNTPLVNNPVTFGGASCTGGGSGLSASWNYGDNTSGLLTSHTYTKSGSYTVTLSCSDDSGQVTSASVTFSVLGPLDNVNCASTKAAQGWCWQYTYPLSDNIVAVSMADSNTGWAISANGGILHTFYTASQQFALQYLGSPAPVVNGQSVNIINAIDTNNAWAAIGNTVLRTTNTGTNWNTINYVPSGTASSADAPVSIIGLAAVDADNAWLLTTTANSATTGQYDVLQTQDGGSTWSLQVWTTNNINDVPTALSARNMTNVWVACADGWVYHSSDGGQTFQHQSQQLLDTYTVEIPKQVASGATVITKYVPVSRVKTAPLTSIRAYSDNNTVWVAGNNNHVWQTVNGGQTWNETVAQPLTPTTPTVSGNGLGATDINFISLSAPDNDSGTAYLVGTVPGTAVNLDMLLPTICSPFSSDCTQALSFPDNSMLFSTNDNGNDWTSIENWNAGAPIQLDWQLPDSSWATEATTPNPILESQYDARAVFATSGNTAFGVGTNGDYFTLGGAQAFLAPKALDPSNIAALGQYAATLTPKAGIRDVFYSVAASDAATGWAVTGSGTVIATTNGGNTWATQALPAIGRLTSITYTSNTLWAAGPSAGPHRQGWTYNTPAASYSTASPSAKYSSPQPTLFRSTNGGTNWVALNTNHTTDVNGNSVSITGDVYSISAANSYTAWAVGQDTSSNPSTPLVLYTNDGGYSWHKQLLPVATAGHALSSVHAVDSTHVWIVGQKGLVLYTSNAGIGTASGSNMVSSWNVQTSSVIKPTVDLTSIAVVNPTTAWISAADGSIYAYNGINWTLQGSAGQYVSQISAVDATHAWAVGFAAPNSGSTSVILTLTTTNGVSTWKAQQSGTLQPLLGVLGLDASNVWVVGAGNTILRTQTGGN